MINKKEDSERKVIFLDIDGVMQPCCNENRFRHDIRQTQKDVAEKMGDEGYLKLDRYDVAAVYYDWDAKAVENLKKLINDCDADVVISSDWKRSKSIDDLRLLFRLHGLDEYINEVTPFEIVSSKADDINEYLKLHPGIKKYVVIDDLDMEKYFPGHMVCTIDESRLDDESLKKAEEILK